MKENRRTAPPFDEKFEERTVRSLREEFARRQEDRRLIERGWELNMNFLSGNQYCGINPAGEIEEEQPRYWWQYRRVFNHIAPAIDTRIAKLARVRPQLTVRAPSGQERDLRAAQLAADVLRSVREDCALDEVVTRATVWSETCGTAFYKVFWDAADGGRVRITEVSPFEIYPEDLSCASVEEQCSIMHAKALPVSEAERLYGVHVKGQDVYEFSLAPYSAAANFMGGAGAGARCMRRDCTLVIEYYERPTAECPNGRMIVVAGDKLVFYGDLPYKDGKGSRGYPFVRQCAVTFSGAFFGGSIIDRMIPVQRAFNAVKNRKHEYLNRLTMGVLAVEDGSVDADELLEEGLPPGKVLVYRQGATPPALLGADSLPADFTEEETQLLEEFILVSGVSEISSTSRNRTNVTSATGLQMLIDLDDTRLAVTTESIKQAMRRIGRLALQLMRQFAGRDRLMRRVTGGRTETYTFSAEELLTDDVIFEAEDESASSPSRRRSLIYELYNLGLLADEDGKVSDETRERILSALGFAGLRGAGGLASLHTNRAAEENRLLHTEAVPVEAYDDDETHLAEHVRYLLSQKLGEREKERFAAHLAAHRANLRQKAQYTAPDPAQDPAADGEKQI